MRSSAITRRFRQACSLGSYLRMVQHVMCRNVAWSWLGWGKAVRMSLAGSPGEFWFRLGSSDFNTAIEVFCEGEYAEVVQTLRDVRVVVDLGANVGYSCMVWRSAWPRCTVLAVEPDRENLELARSNLEGLTERLGGVDGGGVGNSHYLQVGVGSADGHAALDRSAGPWAYRLEGGSADGEVEVATMARVLAALPPGEQVDLLKCDIEGSEAEVFRAGAARVWLSRVRHLVVETHAPYNLEQLEADLAAAGAALDRLSVSHHGPCTVAFYRVKSVSGGG